MIDPLARWRAVGERPDFAGLPSWSAVPYTEAAEDLADADVVIVGAPSDDLTSDRPGARFGPGAIRRASLGFDARVGSARNLLSELRVIDYGDAAVRPGDHVGSHAAIAELVRDVVRAGAMPVVLGGDHAVTGPALRACAEGHGQLALVHLDAHTDTATTVFGAAPSHGSVMRELVEDGSVEPGRYVQLGLRGWWPPPDVFAWQESLGITAFTMDDLDRDGLDSVLARLAAIVGSTPAYLSIDVDVADPGAAPGTGTPEPGGLSARELLRCARHCGATLNLVGMDIVEVAPLGLHDPTAHLADRAVREVLTAHAERARESNGVAAVRARE